MSQWQLFPDLPSDEFEALKADIAEKGVLVPVEYAEDGKTVLDGHHRVRACDELGIKDWPSVVRGGMDDEAKAEHVLTLNLSRRHLTKDQRRELVRKLRIEREWSLPRIAKRLGVSVGTVHSDTQGFSPESLPERVKGSDGKKYAAKKPSPSIFTPSSKQRDRAATAMQELGDDAPTKTLDVKRAERMARERAAERKRQEPTEPTTSHGEAEVRHGDFRKVLSDLEGQVDAIVTDPPYPGEFIDLFGDLAALAAKLLKPSGVLVAMTGQFYLPDYMRLLGEHLDYRWCGAYLAHGRHTRVQARKLATGWKPILVYQRRDADTQPFFLDIFRSADDDKNHHHWGQSESGTGALVEAFTEPGALVVDPFLGGGTTAIVSRDLGRKFIGCDLDAAAIATARERLAA